MEKNLQPNPTMAVSHLFPWLQFTQHSALSQLQPHLLGVHCHFTETHPIVTC